MNPFDGMARDASSLFEKWEWVAYIIAILLVLGIIFLVFIAKNNPEDIGFFETYNLRGTGGNGSNETNETNTTQWEATNLTGTTSPSMVEGITGTGNP